MIEIREASKADEAAVRHLIGEAFGDEEGAGIADLVEALMVDPTAQPVISLVAVIERETVGHILFSNVRIDTARPAIQAAILAPLSVSPEYQRRGIGGALVKEGLSKCRQAGCDLVFVLGHPSYYPKHGFIPARVHDLDAPYPIAPQNADAWMVEELRPKAIESTSGRVICADSLMDPKYWRE